MRLDCLSLLEIREILGPIFMGRALCRRRAAMASDAVPREKGPDRLRKSAFQGRVDGIRREQGNRDTSEYLQDCNSEDATWHKEFTVSNIS